MRTRYGDLDDAILERYKERLIAKIFKLLPLKEEGNETLNKYIDSLLVELIGGKYVVPAFQNNPDYLSLINSLEGLKHIDNFALYRSKVFECISICKKL